MSRPSFLYIFVILGFILAGCELVSSIDENERIVEGVSLTELFREPTPSEIDAVAADWSTRSTVADNVRIEKLSVVNVGASQATLQIVSHDVGDVKHYGAVISPVGGAPRSRPVLVYSHGGDAGVSVDELLTVLEFIESIADKFVYVIPSFRSESLRYDGESWTSDGPPSPWDHDVDDALSLLSAAGTVSPTANLNRVGVLGLSRGAGVGLLMGIRDPRIEQVIEFFGPTDFFGPFVQDVVEEALNGSLRDLPGLNYLDESFIQPVKNGTLTIEDVRTELIRRSPVLFVDRIPELQIHHGTEDPIVSVSQAERLIAAMQSAGRMEPSFESYLYVGGLHSPFYPAGKL